MTDRLGSLLHELRRAARALAGSPGFAVVAAATLALGIGANTVIFSVVNPVVLRKPPYRDPDRLVVVLGRNVERGFGSYSVSPKTFGDWRERATSFEELAAVRGVGGTSLLAGAGLAPQTIEVAAMSPGFLSMLGVRPWLGRSFLPEEAHRPARAFSGAVCILSYALWQRAFGGDPDTVGRRILLNGASSTIVGVMPADFEFRADHDIWVPLADASAMQGEDPHVRVLAVYGRVKPRVSLAQVQSEMDAIAAREADADPVHDEGWGALVAPLQDFYLNRARAREILFLVFGVAGLVLVICCANVAALTLARTAGRRHEIAVRLALGAGRTRLVWELLAESVLLAAAGGAAGMLLALWGMPLLKSLLPSLPSFRADAIGLDLPVLLFTSAVSMAAAVLFGLTPAVRSSKADVSSSLKLGGRCTGGQASAAGARRGLVAGEFAIGVVVVVSAGLALRTLSGLQRVDPGIDADHVLTMGLYCPVSHYPTEADITRFSKRLSDRLQTLPGVRASGLTINPPLDGGLFVTTPVSVEGRVSTKRGDLPNAITTTATPGYFEAFGIGLAAGRFFDERDMDDGAPRVVIVSRRLARALFPDGSAVGRRVRLGEDPAAPIETVAGVVDDIHHDSLAAPADLEIYEPVYRGPYWEPRTLVVRVAGRPEAFVREVDEAVHALDADQPVSPPRPMTDAVAASLARQRLASALLGASGLLALALAAIGIYGLVSYAPTQRTHEIGIRLTLGATEAGVLRLVARENLRPALSGIAAGLIASVGVARAMRGFLYGVGATDGTTMLAAGATLVAVALAACYVPARRASRMQPTEALRCQ